MNIIKRIILVLTTALAMQSITSCDIFYSLDLENHYGKGVYIWSQETGLKKGNDQVVFGRFSTTKGNYTTSNQGKWVFRRHYSRG